MYATLGGDSQLDHINLLIQAGADIRKKDKQGKSAFYYAARNGYVHTFWRLVEELDEKEKLPLFNEIMPEAVLSKNHDFIEELIQKGAKTSHQKKLGQTPLSSALFTRDKNILLSVLEAGAEVNPGNDGARSTLISAVNFLWPEGARIILEHGANYKNFSNNFTPYMALGRKAENGGYMHLWEELVEILEPLDIPVNQTDDWDCTALDYVCGARNLLEMKQCEQQDFFTDFLMDKGADPFRKSSEDGKSPMERALLKGLDNIVRIMKEKSA
jgi:ankyrin repeat protein